MLFSEPPDLLTFKDASGLLCILITSECDVFLPIFRLLKAQLKKYADFPAVFLIFQQICKQMRVSDWGGNLFPNGSPWEG